MKFKFLKDELSLPEKMDVLLYNATVELLEHHSLEELNLMSDFELLVPLSKKLDEMKAADEQVIWAKIAQLKEQFTNGIISKEACELDTNRLVKQMDKVKPIIDISSMTSMMLLSKQTKQYITKLYPEFRMEQIKEGLTDSPNYTTALSLAKQMFTDVYETDNAQLAAEQLLFTLINCKRALFSKQREAQTMLAIIGNQASGKTTFAECLYEVIHKEKWMSGTMKLSSLVNDRSVEELGKDLLIVINEKSKFDKESANALKDLITGDYYMYKPLYRDPIHMKKLAQIIVTSNSDMTDTFWVDGQSRRLSQFYINAIKKQMTRDELIELLTKIWVNTPIEYPYNPIEFVKTNNLEVSEDKAVEDDIFEKIISDEVKQDFLVNYSTKRRSVTDYMSLLDIKSRDKVRGYLNRTEYFDSKINHGTRMYTPTKKFIERVKAVGGDDE